jgi:hypothetical protein
VTEIPSFPAKPHGRLTIVDQVKDAMVVNYYLFVLAWSSMYQQLIERFGEEGRRLAATASEDMGRKWSEAMLGIAQEDRSKTTAADIARSYHESMQFFGYDNEIVESSETRAVVRVTKCPLLEYWREQYPDLIPHACSVEPYIDVGSYRHINPKVKLTIPCKLSEGAAYSDYVITIDEEGVVPELVDQGTTSFEEYLSRRAAGVSDYQRRRTASAPEQSVSASSQP